MAICLKNRSIGNHRRIHESYGVIALLVFRTTSHHPPPDRGRFASRNPSVLRQDETIAENPGLIQEGESKDR